MNHSIEYFEKQHEYLYKYLLGLTQNVLSLEKIFVELISLIQQFSRGLQGIGEKLHSLISDANEADILVASQQQMSNYLLKMAQDWEETGNKISSEVSEPFQQFVGNFRSTNRQLNAESKRFVDDLRNARQAMSKCQEEYWKLMRLSEEQSNLAQTMVDSIERGERTKDDFQRQINHSLRMQETAEEAERDYKKLISITNDKWKIFFETIDKIFTSVGLNEMSRITFSKQTIVNFLKVMHGEEEKINELELKGQEKIEIRKLIEKKMEQNGLIHNFQYEQFVSFEQFKKINPIQQKIPILESKWQIVGDELKENERQLLDLYIHTLFCQDLSDKSEMIINLKQLLQKSSARQYFIDQLHKMHQKYISEKQASFYLNLTIEQFSELLLLIKHWLKYIDLNDCYDCEEIYNLLQRSIRIVKVEKKERISLASQLGDLPLWNRIDKWSDLYFFISAKKVDEKKKQAQALFDQTQNNIVRKGIKIIGKGVSFLKNFRQQQSSQQQFEVNENEIAYLILEDINLFISALRLPTEISSEIILQIAFQQQQFDKDHVVKLLEKQEELHNYQWKKTLKQGKVMLTQKIEKYEQKKLFQYQNKAIQAFNFTLQFLPISDHPEKLLLINSDFNKALKQKIIKYYFMSSFETKQQIRLRYIQNVLGLQKNPIDYIKLKVDIGVEMDLNKQNYEETIALDVARSLHIHKNKISTSVLQSLLRIYAYYNQDVGYCQGMNYIAGFLYLTFNDEIEAYRAFDKVMNLYFKDMYINDFQRLKCAFYQFERLLGIFLPELQQHLKDQKIDASYYVASWMITMYSNVFQYTMKSALLSIFWDIFLVEGWKGFYKCSFFIFSIIEKKILELEFDEILHYLGRLIKDELFQIDNEYDLLKLINTYQEIDVDNFHIKKIILNKYRISNRLLKSLEQEYNCFQVKFTKKLNQYLKT